MHNGPWPMALQQCAENFAVAHVPLGEAVSRIGRNAQQVAEIARISKLVEIDDRGPFPLHPLQNEVGTDEPRSPCNENRFFHTGRSALCNRCDSVWHWPL